MNSEISQEFLRRFAASPSVIADFETGLKRDSMANFVPFEYDKLKENFGLKDLERDLERGQPG
jgi:predicted transcriptional regulator